MVEHYSRLFTNKRKREHSNFEALEEKKAKPQLIPLDSKENPQSTSNPQVATFGSSQLKNQEHETRQQLPLSLKSL